MQISDLVIEKQIPPLFRLGFRPFFLVGAMFSLISLFIWGAFLQGLIDFYPYGGSYFWHMHEMIYGFTCAIIAGFLLTAVQNWTGIRGVSSWQLLTLLLLWLAGRVAMAIPSLVGMTLSALVDILFLPTVAVVLAKPILRIKQYRNLIFIPILSVLTLLNIAMHSQTHGFVMLNIHYLGLTTLLIITLLMSLIAGRVTPMFTANGTNTRKVNNITAIEVSCIMSLLFLIINFTVAAFIGLNSVFTAILFAWASSSQLARLIRWQPWKTYKVPLLWSLHGSLLLISLGLLLLSYSYLNDNQNITNSWHLLTVGGMAGLIIAMISRVSLGHTGRSLIPPKAMTIAFIAIFASAIVRTIGPWLAPLNSMVFYSVSITLWILAYALFCWYYGPMLLSERIDGRPG